MLERYNPSGIRIVVSRLGVCDPGFSAARSDDGIFRIVSCSFMVPVKRLHLLIESLKVFAQSRDGIPVEWYHIGDGPLREDLEKAATNLLPSTVRWYFKGQVDNREVIEFYRTHPVDVFVNVSESEGIPVSIMEAQSCGIPVIATAVGGTPEIVNNRNGVLLESSPSPVSVARALESVALNEGETRKKKEMAKKTWESMYNAERNYKEFVNLIGTCFNKER